VLFVLGAALAACFSPVRPAGAAESPYTISFEGNEALSEEKLREAASAELEDFGKGGQTRADADDAAYQMETLYGSLGYAFAEVNYDYDRDESGVRVSYLVSEGPRVLLRRVTLEGTDAVSPEELMPFFAAGRKGITGNVLELFTLGMAGDSKDAAPYVASAIEEAAGGIGDYYYGKGFIEARVEDPRTDFSEDRSLADVTVQIYEGPKHTVHQVGFSGDLLPATEEDLAKVAAKLKGAIYRARGKSVLKSRVMAIYGNAGYADVQVEVTDSRGEEPGEVILEAAIVSGPRVKIGGIAVEGNTKTRESFIRRRIAFEAGDWYEVRKAQESLSNLYRTGLFAEVTPTLEGEGEERDAKVSVRELPSRAVLADVGWGSYEKLRGRVGFEEKNFFGTGRLAGAEIGGSMKGFFIGTKFSDPWFLGTKWTASLPFEFSIREEPSYSEEKLDLSALLTRTLARRTTVSLKYSYEFANTTRLEGVDPDPNLQEQYNLSAIRLRLSRDRRNDLFYPSGGWRGSTSFEVADPLLGGDVSYLRLTFAGELFLALGEKTVFATRYAVGLLYPTHDETALPLPERFFNGGENTVRSFREDQLGPKDLEGDATGGIGGNIVNFELRRRLAGNWAGSLFVDVGNVVPNQSRIEQGLPPYDSAGDVFDDAVKDFFSDFSYAVGAGIQYLLPVGPARVDVAVNPDPKEGEEKWLAHFTLGMAF
jgi:outer membrane protein insertion porin family